MPAKENTDLFCPLQQKRCGGCSRLSVPYEKQLHAKDERVRALFPFAKKIIGMDTPVHYRNKIISAYAHDKTGLISGLYAFGTHYVLPVNACLLESVRGDDIAVLVRKTLAKFDIKSYDENKKTGLIRFVQVRYAHITKQALVTLVTAKEELPHANEIAAEIRAVCPDVRSVVQNINPRPGSAVLGFKERVLSGDGIIEDELCGVRIRLSSRCFYQINSIQAEKLYDKALDMCQITEKDTVLDAYCGIGVIGLIAAKKAGQVVGIELNADSVRQANLNATLNHLSNIRFIQGDAAQKIRDAAQSFDIALLDPPREGASQEFLAALCEKEPKKICYISCNIVTQKRDVDFLAQHGYRAVACQPVDLFPHTNHIESIVLLVKQ